MFFRKKRNSPHASDAVFPVGFAVLGIVGGLGLLIAAFVVFL